MPFTPFHMGPGLLVKALLQGSFSLMVFGWAQIMMDIQPMIFMVTGSGQFHGFTHTYLGAGIIGLFSALTGKYAAQFALRRYYKARHLPITWPVALFSAMVGTISHVVLDSFMHADMQQFAPFLHGNPMLHVISLEMLHNICVVSALVGAILYFAISRWLIAKQNKVILRNGPADAA
ncbi:MAG: hypothetical protein V4805_10595 [Pseudomonadota bacterium]